MKGQRSSDRHESQATETARKNLALREENRNLNKAARWHEGPGATSEDITS